MKEAVGSSMLLYIVIIVVGVIMLLFVSIMSYTKAYSAKNKIISAIETFEGYDDSSIEEISANLSKMGYTITAQDFCNSTRVKNHLKELGISGATNLNNSAKSKYGYCVYEVSTSRSGKYYVVATFINFSLPIVGTNFVFPVYGQTKIMGIDYSYN